jgi:hypothetical protein
VKNHLTADASIDELICFLSGEIDQRVKPYT